MINAIRMHSNNGPEGVRAFVWAFTHHSDGSEGKQVVVLLTVAPRIPTRILALLQDVHLTAEVHLLKAHKTAEGT